MGASANLGASSLGSGSLSFHLGVIHFTSAPRQCYAELEKQEWTVLTTPLLMLLSTRWILASNLVTRISASKTQKSKCAGPGGRGPVQPHFDLVLLGLVASRLHPAGHPRRPPLLLLHSLQVQTTTSRPSSHFFALFVALNIFSPPCSHSTRSRAHIPRCSNNDSLSAF